MKSFKQFLLENQTKYVAIYGGRFQPMHKGHHSVYRKACDMFGKDNVYISTSNKINLDDKKGKISPFNFEDKKRIMTDLYGIDEDKIVQTKSPIFAPAEIVSEKPDHAVIMIVGDKDVDRYHAADYSEFVGFDHLAPNGHYFYNAGNQEGGLSSTDIRSHLSTGYKEAFSKVFGKYDEDLHNMVQDRLQAVSK